MAAVVRIAAGFAHEINTPIQYVSDNIRFLREAFSDLARIAIRCSELEARRAAGEDAGALLADLAATAAEVDLAFLAEQVPHAIDRALDGSARVAELVGAIKDFGRPIDESRIATQLNRLVLQTMMLVQNETRRVAEVETTLGDLPPVFCFVGALGQVIAHLLVNAVHAIEDTGPARGKIRVATHQDGDHAVIEIGDSGCGIPDHVAGRIFEPFFTTKPTGKGSGEGLFVARQTIVERHGGTLSFVTSVGEGTTFVIRLPLDPVLAASEQPDELFELPCDGAGEPGSGVGR